MAGVHLGRRSGQVAKPVVLPLPVDVRRLVPRRARADERFQHQLVDRAAPVLAVDPHLDVPVAVHLGLLERSADVGRTAGLYRFTCLVVLTL
jgi:hypothetical protein